MRRLLLTLLASSCLLPAARAADDPQLIPGANDTHIRAVEYSDKTVTRLTSTDLVPITITYGDGEEPMLIAGLKVVVITRRKALTLRPPRQHRPRAPTGARTAMPMS